ncbi:nuclear transport factor 2 family protein [Balneatrix alpica]|uniref:Nuclear transport factor 2 family protein n=1 Tax=Balneatrix alpica TaxID=75684 RepID=A0ABV5Z798_9GAMM|nr:nuclear transport factor 2 family protein [Balneatrix alpica]
MSFQDEKALVRAHYQALAQATPQTVAAVLAERTSDNWLWRGMHPFHVQQGASNVATAFWAPFLTSMSRVQRREDIFIAGKNEIDGFQSVWTISMGHLLGLFDQPFLGIPATRRIAMLRYAEFNKVENGQITETAMFFDLIHLMHQAGLRPLPTQTGAHLVQPGPLTHDGLHYGETDPSIGAETLALINRMIGDINTSERFSSPQQELSLCWHDDMLWWGPDGIGATYTIDRYIEQHQRPFRTQIKDRQFNGHLCRLAEGNFGGFFGWANLTVTNSGGYMGLPASTPADMRVVDMYRRDGDKLAENWIFIDILHFLNMQGLDVLGRMQQLSGTASQS